MPYKAVSLVLAYLSTWKFRGLEACGGPVSRSKGGDGYRTKGPISRFAGADRSSAEPENLAAGG